MNRGRLSGRRDLDASRGLGPERLEELRCDHLRRVDPCNVIARGKSDSPGCLRHRQQLRDGTEELLDSLLTPPAVVNGKLFFGTLDGRVLCLSAISGDVLWTATVGEPVVFQPVIVDGQVYLPTGTGSLFCLKTGDPTDTGWSMWGATAAHNGRPDDLTAEVGAAEGRS